MTRAVAAVAGKRVLVTRAAHQAGKLSEGLRALGAEPVEVPVLEIRPPVSFEPLDRGAAPTRFLRLADSDQREYGAGACGARGRAWIVVGIADAVCRWPRWAKLPQPRRAMPALPSRWFRKTYVAEALVECLAGQAAGKRFLLARAEVARDVIPDALRARGRTVDVVDAYRNVMPEAAPALLARGACQGIDAATFTSSSSVTHLAEAARQAGIAFPFAGVAAMSIGPITSADAARGWVGAGCGGQPLRHSRA